MEFEEENKVFEIKVRDIYHDIRYEIKLEKEEQVTNDDKLKGIHRKILAGFKSGQKKILTELTSLQIQAKENQILLKTARRERNKNRADELVLESKFIQYQDSIYRNLADTIAWQMLNGEHYLYRRFYTGEMGTKDLSDNSFKHVVDFTEQVNADQDAFCLIADITNNIQLGDCLIRDKDGIKVSEIKSGEMNFKALDIINDRKLTDDDFNEKKLSEEFEDKFIKQMKRMVSQKGKTDRAAKIILENVGPDPKYKETDIHIVENDFQIDTYHSELLGLLGELRSKDYAYTSVGAIVNIGVYKNDWRVYGQFTMKQLCDPYPFVDLMASRGVLICEPIFLKPFPENVIMDIVFGRIKVFIGIDYNNFIKFSNDLGVGASWSTAKELQNYLQKFIHDKREIFSIDNKGIKLEIDGNEIFVGHGFFTKILFDHFSPETMILKYVGMIADIGNKKK
nr:hypothetical protein [uncultured Chryseobacterium sp.]